MNSSRSGQLFGWPGKCLRIHNKWPRSTESKGHDVKVRCTVIAKAKAKEKNLGFNCDFGLKTLNNELHNYYYKVTGV